MHHLHSPHYTTEMMYATLARTPASSR